MCAHNICFNIRPCCHKFQQLEAFTVQSCSWIVSETITYIPVIVWDHQCYEFMQHEWSQHLWHWEWCCRFFFFKFKFFNYNICSPHWERPWKMWIHTTEVSSLQTGLHCGCPFDCMVQLQLSVQPFCSSITHRQKHQLKLEFFNQHCIKRYFQTVMGRD